MRLNSVSLCDAEADVLWLSEGALGPDEHSVVIEAIGALQADTSLPYFEFGMEDGRLAVFLAIRAPKGDLVGVAMILAEMKAVPDGVVERIVTPQVRTILQKIAVFLRSKTNAPAADANGAPAGAAGAPVTAGALAPNAVEEILTLELTPEAAPPKPVVEAAPAKGKAAGAPAVAVRAGATPAATAAAKAPPAASPPPRAEVPVARVAPVVAAKNKAAVPPAKAAPPAKAQPAPRGGKPSTPPAIEGQVLPPAAMDELEFVMEGVPTARPATEEETTAEVPAVSEEFVLSIADTGMMQVIPAAAQPKGKAPPAAKPAGASGATSAKVAAPIEVPVAKPAAASESVSAKAPPAAAPIEVPVAKPAAPAAKAAAPATTPAAAKAGASSEAAAAKTSTAAPAKPAAQQPEPVEEVALIEDAGHTVIAPPGVLAGKVAAAFKASADASDAGTDLVLHVQELIKLRSNGRTRRYEVLARSRSDASREEVPAHFIADSAQGQEGSVLDGYVVQRLLTWLGEHGETVWDTEPASFSINLSIGAIEDPQFAASVEAALEASAVPTEHIGFEITEFACVQCKPQVQRFVEMVERLGCFLVIDNFTFDTRVLQLLGSSALRAVKVDPKLTQIAMKDKLSQAIVVAIAQACKVMGVHCVAKRIDSQAALQWLTAVGCDFAQGYAL